MILISCNTDKQEVKTPFIDSSLLKKQQDGQKLLLKKIKEADTVLLVSHIGYEDIYDYNVKNKNNKIVEGLLINGRPHFSIIKEKKQLLGKSIDSLISIFSIQYKESKEDVALKCFDPQHAVLLIKNGKVSFIDMCFHCLGYKTSDDLNELEPFDKRKWQAVFKFFKQNGFTYEMPKVIAE